MKSLAALSSRITLALWLVWFLVYWRGGQRILDDMRRQATARRRFPGPVLSSVVAFSVPFGGLLVCLAPEEGLQDPEQDRRKDQDVSRFLGMFLTLVGVGGSFYSHHTIGQYWTVETKLVSQHALITQGPYGIVRHPVYSFVLLMCGGTALVFPSRWKQAIMSMMMLGYVLKTAEEDRFLAQHLPGYGDYQQQVPYRLIPRLW